MENFEKIKDEAKNIIAIFDSECSTTIDFQNCWDRMENLVREIAKL